MEVEIDGVSGAEGEAATSLSYQALGVADATEAEIQNTLRASTPATLTATAALTAPE